MLLVLISRQVSQKSREGHGKTAFLTPHEIFKKSQKKNKNENPDFGSKLFKKLRLYIQSSPNINPK